MRRLLFQGTNGLFLLLFVTASAVQYNDSDPWLWVSVYGAGALCCGLFLTNYLPAALSAAVTGICLLGSLYLGVRIFFGPLVFFDTTGREMMGVAEKTREMFGLLVTGLWVAILTWRAQSSDSAPAS